MRKRRVTATSIALALCSIWTAAASSSEFERTCQGNLETSNREIIKAGVSYKLSYNISGAKAKVRFAGREFDAVVESGKSWKGLWIKRIDDDVYFSFLPNDGGTIKFQFEPDRWYSGNC